MTNRLDFEKVRTRSITHQNPVENALSALASRLATSIGVRTYKFRKYAEVSQVAQVAQVRK